MLRHILPVLKKVGRIMGNSGSQKISVGNAVRYGDLWTKLSMILMGAGMCLVCYLEAKKKNYPKRDKMLSAKESRTVLPHSSGIWQMQPPAFI